MIRSNTLKIKFFRREMISWYSDKGRHFPWRNKSASCYQLIVVEVLLQRTRAETVATFYREFIRHYPSWKSLANAAESNLRVYLKPIGLWKQRASVLRRLSNEMAKRKGRFPRTRSEIEKLPGVGQYVANAVELFCLGVPRPLLDVNMARVLERYFGPRKLADIRYDPFLQKLAHDVIPREGAREFNWAILDFAALVCKHGKPLCEICPVSSRCFFYKTDLN